MQPPIAVGSVLQNRYRVMQILGQGGFGRTYLAEDQRRFNELCAIKELILTVTGTQAWEKAQELFHREASILYQIEHPQVPKFRERFEQDQRLFLVEDYVAGKTYRSLLADRQLVNQAFTETEVLQLLRSLLPVLQHIHDRGIIHRDISPENIILRDSDKQPVLIDFGVVKELATRIQSPDSTAPITSVGKLGYAPSEQMQTGRAYPSSDLFSLAVTAIVLLTGKEPTDLFDETQLTWNWQRWVTVNPQFAEILNRMLNYAPGDRFQSATEVSQALYSVNQPHIPVSSPELSNVQTIAVGRRPDFIPPVSPNKPEPLIPPSRPSSILDNPLALGAIGSAVVILAGFGSWTLVSSIRSQSKSQPDPPPQTFPSPVITGGTTLTPTTEPIPTSTPTPTPTNLEPVISNVRLKLGKSNKTTVTNTLKANQIIQYTFFGEAGDKLTTFFDQGNDILLTVLDSSQQPIDSSAQQVTLYQGTLVTSGRYTIQITLLPGVSESNYRLNVALEKSPLLTPTPTPTLTPTQIPIPVPTPTSTPTFTLTPETPTPNVENSIPSVDITPNPSPEQTSSP